MPLDPAPGPDDHVLGPDDARIVLVQYGDFECPYSFDVQKVVHEVRETFPDQIRFVFRHFPLRYHANALRAAIASEEAARQGQFWAFYDRLYANQLRLRADQLVGPRLRTRPRRGGHAGPRSTPRRARPEILAQKKTGVASGVRSTLNLWIDGELFEEDELEDALVSHVIQPLKQAKA